jgi:hypothetical protein
MASATAEKTGSPKATTGKKNGGKTAAKTGSRKAAASTAGSTPRGKYPDNIRAAAKRARELSGTNHGAGPLQHVIVREQLGSQDPVEMSGLSVTRLRDYSQNKVTPTRDELKPLREFAVQCVNPNSGKADPYCKGRGLAAILVAYAEERKASKKS